MQAGKIEIILGGASLEDTERLRLMIHTMFQQGVFNIRNGYAMIHFDHEGLMREIEVHMKKWRNDKPVIPLQNIFDSVKIEVIQRK